MVQWYVIGLLKNIHRKLRMHGIQSFEEALKKSQKIEIDDDWPIPSIDKRMEEKL
jgi:hypothetical protein